MVVGYDWLSTYSCLRSTRFKAWGEWMTVQEKKKCSSRIEGDNRMRLVINRAVTISRSSTKQTSLAAQQQQQARGRGQIRAADQCGSRRHIADHRISVQASQQSTGILYLSLTTTPPLADRGVRKPVMPSLILVVFVIQLALHLISTFGGQPINDLVLLTRSHV